MASITFSDGTIANLTVSELIEYRSACQSTVEIVASAVVKAQAKRNSVKASAEPTTEPNNSSGKVITRCEAHAGKRGTVGNCKDCVRENSGNAPEVAENAPQDAPKQRKQGGNGGQQRFAPKPLEEMPDDKPASDNQISRIHVQLNERNVAAKTRKAYETEIASGVSVRRAAEIYRTLKKLPLK